MTLRGENEALEKYRAPQDLEHSFKANWIYELPFGRGKWFWRRREWTYQSSGWRLGMAWHRSHSEWQTVCTRQRSVSWNGRERVAGGR